MFFVVVIIYQLSLLWNK